MKDAVFRVYPKQRGLTRMAHLHPTSLPLAKDDRTCLGGRNQRGLAEGEASMMISKVEVRKAGSGDDSLFEVGYHNLEKKSDDGHWRTTEYGTEKQMRDRLKSLGLSDEEIDKLFSGAKAPKR
jgi:hypothetical protein